MLHVNNGRWCQASYETASRDAGRRAKQLRQLGYQVSVSSLGPQVTRVGTIKTTLVDIRPGSHADTYGLPEVNVVRW
jgi:hypothetical protein